MQLTIPGLTIELFPLVESSGHKLTTRKIPRRNDKTRLHNQRRHVNICSHTASCSMHPCIPPPPPLCHLISVVCWRFGWQTLSRRKAQQDSGTPSEWKNYCSFFDYTKYKIRRYSVANLFCYSKSTQCPVTWPFLCLNPRYETAYKLNWNILTVLAMSIHQILFVITDCDFEKRSANVGVYNCFVQKSFSLIVEAWHTTASKQHSDRTNTGEFGFPRISQNIVANVWRSNVHARGLEHAEVSRSVRFITLHYITLYSADDRWKLFCSAKFMKSANQLDSLCFVRLSLAKWDL